MSTLGKRDDKDPKCCDWSSDGCSHAPEKPSGFNFHQSCLRHDFGYRNFKKLDKFTEKQRLKIDDNFKKDLTNECKKQKDKDDVKKCKREANVYYLAVRAGGGL